MSMKTTSLFANIAATRHLRRLFALPLLIAAMAAHPALAATQYAAGTITWDNATTAAWSAASGGPYTSQWTSGNDAVFEGTAGTVTIASPTAHNLTFNSTSYVLSGASTLTLNGTAPTITTGSAIAATIGNNTATVIGGSAGLTKTGAGTLTLNGSAVNTFTGTLNLSGGTLALDFANMSPPTDLLNSAVIPNGVGGTLTLKAKSGGGTSQTLGIPNSDQGYVTKILADPNGGTVALTMGTIDTNFDQKAKTGRILMLGKTAGSTGTFSLTTVAGTGGRILYTSDGATAAAGTSMDYWGTTGASSYTPLTASNTGGTTYFTLGGSLTRTNLGAVGGIKITPSGAGQSLILGAGANQLISVLATGTDAYSITGGNIASPDTTGGSQFVVHQYNTGGLTISSVIEGVGGNGGTLFKSGPGTLTLSGANVFGDITWLAEGTLSFATISNGGNGTSYAINTTTGSAIVTMAGTSTTTGLVAGMALARPNEFVNTSRILSITDSTHFVMDTNAIANATGSATKTLAGFASNLGMAPAAAANLVIGDATLQFTGTTATSNRAFTIVAGKTATFDITGTSLTMAGATGTTTTGGLTKTGAGTLILTGTNTYSGATTVTNGTLRLNNANTSNETSTVTIASTAALELNFAGTDIVGKLFIDSTPMANGVYKAVGSAATGIECAQITGTGTLTVGPVAATYTVTYNGNVSDGGTVPTDSGTYLNGATVTVLTNSGGLTKTGFVFSGWNTQANGLGTDRPEGGTFVMGSANVILYAKWVSTTTYTVTYDGNGSDGGTVPTDSGAYLNGATVTVLTNSGGLTKTGFVFTGWNTLATGLGTARPEGGTFVMGTANVTLYAKWVSAATYTVTYDGNGSDGGTVPVDSGAYLNGATVTVLTNSGVLTKTGFVFTGWNTLATGNGTSYAASGSATFTMGTANVTLYAKWVSAATYTVTYDGNGSTGGSVPTDSGNYLNGATVTVLANSGSLTRTNSVFAGWNTQANGGGTSYAATGSVTFTMGAANVTLYAMWTVTATWANTGTTNANWTTTDNWVGGIVPGSTAAITGNNADASVAIFNTALGTYGSVGNPVVIDSASENIKSITFDTAAGDFVIGSTGLNPLYLSGGGTIQIAGTLTATNATETINAPLVIEGAGGTYAITNNSASGTGAGAATLDLGGGITGGAAGTTVLTLSGTNTNANTISGVIGNGSATSLAITKAGASTWILASANSYTGSTTISVGTLKLGASSSGSNSPLGTAAAGTTVSATGAALDLNGFNIGTAEALSITGTGVGTTGALTNSGAAATYAGAVTLAAAASIGGGDIALSAGLVGNVILTKVGAGTLTLSGASSRTGETKLDAGKLILNNDSALGSGQLTFTSAGTTLDNTSGAPRTLTNALATSSTYDFSVFNSGSTATSNLTFTGTAALAIPSAGSPPPPRTITLLGTGTTLTLGAVTAQANAAGGKLQIDGPGNTLVMASLITNTNTASAHNFTLQGSANVAINGTVSNPSGAGSFTMAGTGTLTFKGANTYTGATVITAGTLKMGTGASLQAASSVSIAAGATFDLTDLTSASATYTWNTTSLSASGAATAATITGTSGGAVDMGIKPISLTFDGSHPSLTVAGASLLLGGNQFTVVVPGTALGGGVYTLVSADSISGGTVNPTPLYTGGHGVAAGATGVVSISGNTVILTVTGGTTYAVTYNGNGNTGGTPPTDSGSYASGATVTVLGAGTLIKSGFAFAGWNTVANGTGTGYNPAATFLITANTTLYAQWIVNYSSWAAAYAGGGLANEDYDHDGVSNGVEYFMNAPAGFTANPALDPSTHTITWTNGGNIPSSAYGTQFVVQTSNDLAAWADVLISDSSLTNTAGAVSYTLTGTAPRFVRLKVTPN